MPNPRRTQERLVRTTHRNSTLVGYNFFLFAKPSIPFPIPFPFPALCDTHRLRWALHKFIQLFKRFGFQQTFQPFACQRVKATGFLKLMHVYIIRITSNRTIGQKVLTLHRNGENFPEFKIFVFKWYRIYIVIIDTY